MSPTQALKKVDVNNEERNQKEDKMIYNFSISDSKAPLIMTPTPNKKDFAYNVSGTKLYKEEVVVPDLNNQLFSQDLGEDENNKSPFSFLKKTSSIPQSTLGAVKNREAFNNITNTINKSPSFEDKEGKSKFGESNLPRSRGASVNKIGTNKSLFTGPH